MQADIWIDLIVYDSFFALSQHHYTFQMSITCVCALLHACKYACIECAWVQSCCESMTGTGLLECPAQNTSSYFMTAFYNHEVVLVFYTQTSACRAFIIQYAHTCTHTDRCDRQDRQSFEYAVTKLRGSIRLLLSVSCACHPAQPAPLPAWLSLLLLWCCDTEPPTQTHEFIGLKWKSH